MDSVAVEMATYCPIELFNPAGRLQYGTASGFMVKESTLVMQLRLGVDGTESLVDLLAPDYLEQARHAFHRAGLSGVLIHEVFFKVHGNVTPLATFVSDPGCPLNVLPLRRAEGTGVAPLSFPPLKVARTRPLLSPVPTSATAPVAVPRGALPKSVVLPPGMVRVQEALQALVDEAERCRRGSAATSRDRVLKLTGRRHELRLRADTNCQTDRCERMLLIALAPRLPMSVLFPEAPRWNEVADLDELHGLASYAQSCSSGRVRLFRAARYCDQQLESAFHQSAPAAAAKLPKLRMLRAGKTSEFLGWRGYEPSEERVRGFAWRPGLLGAPAQLAWGAGRGFQVSSRVQTGNRPCDMAPGDVQVLLVRVRAVACATDDLMLDPTHDSFTQGADLWVREEKALIPAYRLTLSFD